MHYLDIENWNRKEHFELFSTYQEPYWGVTVNVDVTIAKQVANAKDVSLYIYYLHAAVVAAQEVEEFKYRIDEENRILVHDQIHASSTLNRPDGTFGFSQISYEKDFHQFLIHAHKEIERVKTSNALFGPRHTDNVIFFSALPWVHFTSLSHSRNFESSKGIPMISFGKIVEDGGRSIMPVSIHVHHGLVDGMHVGKYIDVFQEVLNS